MIPSTFNSGEEAEFLLRIYVEKTWGSSEDVTDDVTERINRIAIDGPGRASDDGVDGKNKVGRSKSWNQVIKKMKTPKDKFNWCVDSKDELALLKMIMSESFKIRLF